MQRITHVIRWKNADGQENTKDYSTHSEVKRAERWLKDNNAADIEIAVRINQREHKEPEPAAEIPAAENQSLDDAWYNK